MRYTTRLAAFTAVVALVCSTGGVAAVPDSPADLPEMQAPTVAEQIRSAGFPRPDATDLAEWHLGPVRYLLQGPETRLFKSLDDQMERRAFIKQFWLRRDPNTSSLENEFRFEFWRRVLDSNQLYTRSSEPGWKTDRGKYHILLGPPDEVEREVMPRLKSGEVLRTTSQTGDPVVTIIGATDPTDNFLGLERWHYRSRPTPNLPPNFIIAFRLMDTGDYEVSDDPADFSLFYGSMSDAMKPIVEPEAEQTADTSDVEATLLSVYNDLALGLDLGSAQRVPDPDELLSELVTSEEFFGLVPFLLQVDYYKTAGPATLAVFTVGVEGHSLTATDLTRQHVLAVGKLESLAVPDFRILLNGDDALVPAPDNSDMPDRPLFQMVKALPPGEYNATFGVLDRQNNTIGSYRERIRVPAFPAAGLSLSTLALARRLLPLDVPDPDAEASAASPFRLGSYQVVPRTDTRYANGDEFSLYYQVYGARRDPRSGKLDLSVSYQFFVLDGEEFRAIGPPIRHADRTEAVQGWSFPLREWPQATFRLEVTVIDRLSGDVAVGQTIFGVEGVDSEDKRPL